MLKVIIAEDETIFREYLEIMVDWNAYGFEIAGHAKNGIEALALCERIKPDLALLDINMPLLDGLAVSEVLKEKFCEMSIVLITGYNEFEYAHKAIKLGIEDYLVKPVDEDELRATLLKVRARLIQQRSEKEIRKNEIILKRERMLNSLLEGGYDVSEELISKHLDAHRIDMRACSYIVTTIEIDNLQQKYNDRKGITQCKRLVSNTINDLIVTKGKSMVFNGPEDRIISIIAFINNEEIEAFTPETYRNISWFIRKHFDFTVTIGIGVIGAGLEAVRASYLQSLDALRYKVISGIGSVVEFSKIQTQSANLGFYPNEINAKLVMLLRLNDFERIKEELDKIFKDIKTKKLSVDCVHASAIGLSSVCLSYLTEMGVGIEDVMGTGYSPMKIINEKMQIDIVNQTITELFQRTVEYFSGNKSNKARKAADAAKEYIDKNFADFELNLSKIAGTLYLSPDYIRKVFKQELSISVTEYITSIRMKHAKELLDKDNVKISSLCYEVGYNDASYFSKCFKKYYGLSPRDYENINR